LILLFIFDQYNSHIAFLIVFLLFNPITSSMGSYNNTIERLIVAANNNPPVGTTGMTAIVVVGRKTDGTVVVKITRKRTH
jgi:phage terminase large subunit-like protein